VPLRQVPFRAEGDELRSARLVSAPVTCWAAHEQAHHEVGVLVALLLSAAGSAAALERLTNSPDLAPDGADTVSGLPEHGTVWSPSPGTA
jgi:hypothetical protein